MTRQTQVWKKWRLSGMDEAIAIKLWKAFDLGRQLVPKYTDKLTEEESDFAWRYADSDGNPPKELLGRCSIKALVEFDVVAYERSLDNDIVRLEQLCTKEKHD